MNSGSSGWSDAPSPADHPRPRRALKRCRQPCPAEAHMAWGVKRTKLEEMLDEKRQEVGSLSPHTDPRNGSSQDVLH